MSERIGFFHLPLRDQHRLSGQSEGCGGIRSEPYRMSSLLKIICSCVRIRDRISSKKKSRIKNLTRVVVAACSPRMHEKTFRAACQRAGLNPYRAFHMVTVREHSSWVTETEDEATAKAMVIARAGLMRVRNQNALIPSKFSVNPNTLGARRRYRRHAGGSGYRQFRQ